MVKALKSALYDLDPSMVRAITAQNTIHAAMAPYRAILSDMKRQRVQLPITMFLETSQPQVPSEEEN